MPTQKHQISIAERIVLVFGILELVMFLLSLVFNVFSQYVKESLEDTSPLMLMLISVLCLLGGVLLLLFWIISIIHAVRHTRQKNRQRIFIMAWSATIVLIWLAFSFTFRFDLWLIESISSIVIIVSGIFYTKTLRAENQNMV